MAWVNSQSIRRRTAIAFSPANYGSDLGQWLDGQDTNTLYADDAKTTLADNAVQIAVIDDKSSYGLDAVQTSALARPTRNDTGVNGHCAPMYDGGDFMSTAAPITGLSQFEIWCVGKTSDTLNSYQILYETYVGAVVSCVSFSRQPDNTSIASSIGSGGQISTSALSTEGSSSTLHVYRHVTNTVVSSACCVLTEDGTETGTQTMDDNLLSSTMDANAMYLGGRFTTQYPITGTVAEFIIIRRLLSAGEATELLAYLKTKWSIA